MSRTARAAGRPRLAWAALACLALVAGLGSVAGESATIPLRSETQAYQWVLEDGEPLGRPIALKTGVEPDLLPGSRVLDPGLDADPAVREAATAGASRQRAWLAAGVVPDDGGEHADLARGALLDLYVATHTATGEIRPPFAAPTGAWRYVWPRDTAFVAVALARTGHTEDAVAILTFFAGPLASGEPLQSRYAVDGSVPDERGTQLDGAGWLLWAASEVVAAVDPEARDGVLGSLDGVIEPAAVLLQEATAGSSRLPPASMDYWELPERHLTLGTAGPVLAGLSGLASLRLAAGQGDDDAAAAAEHAGAVRTAVEQAFAPSWPRYVGGVDRDAAVSFVLPPFADEPLTGALSAWRLSSRGMARPAGGLAPGERWAQDGYSWTPQTALYALAAAANGDPAGARERLRWIDAHTTLAGSIPEKVAADGAPAQVAPLVWSSALVLLALDELDRAAALS